MNLRVAGLSQVQIALSCEQENETSSYMQFGDFFFVFLMVFYLLKASDNRGRPTNKTCNKITMFSNPKHKNLS